VLVDVLEFWQELKSLITLPCPHNLKLKRVNMKIGKWELFIRTEWMDFGLGLNVNWKDGFWLCFLIGFWSFDITRPWK